MIVFNKTLMRLATLVFAGVMVLAVASPALANSKTSSAVKATSTSSDLYRFIPTGIDPINDVHATQQVIAYAKNNPAYGQALASQTGDTSFVPSAFKANGYRPHAPAGSTNSAAGTGGQVVGVADHGNSASVQVVAIINIHTMQVAYVMVRCGNLRLMRVTPVPWKPIHLGVSATINRSVTKNATITCPSGQKVTGFVTTRVKGVIYARTHGMVKGWAKVWLRQQADIQIKTTLKLKCGPAPKPPAQPTCTDTKASNFGGSLPCVYPPPPPPTVTYTASATATASASATCPDGTTATASASGYGSATSNVSQQDAQNKAQAIANANANANAAAAVKCGSGTPPAPSVTIDIENINDIQAGSCRPVTVTVDSTAAGSVQIKPKYGMIGTVDCYTPSSEQSSVTESVNVGHNTYTVYVWAPSDSSATTDTLTATPTIQGVDASKNTASVTYTISHVQLS